MTDYNNRKLTLKDVLISYIPIIGFIYSLWVARNNWNLVVLIIGSLLYNVLGGILATAIILD